MTDTEKKFLTAIIRSLGFLITLLKKILKGEDV